MPAQPKSAVRSEPFRAWQRMLSGRRLDLLDPSPLDVEIEDIAHGLARVARWNGQTEGAHIFSVAQHSLLVEIIARQRARLDRPSRLGVLLHDAPEYVIGDMISPFKAVIGDAYKAVEARLLAAIHLRFGLPAVLPAELIALIKAADRSAAYLEATRLRRILRRRGAPVLRLAAQVLRRDRARLSHALAGGDRRTALSRTLRQARRRLMPTPVVGSAPRSGCCVRSERAHSVLAEMQHGFVSPKSNRDATDAFASRFVAI